MITYPTNTLQKVTLLGGCEQRNLPAGYTELEYIESSGTQYIDTGIVPTNSDSTRVKFRFALNNTRNGENQSIGSNGNLNMYASSSLLKFRANASEIKDFDTDWHIVEMSKSSYGKEVIFDGVTYTKPTTTEQPNNFCLFAMRASDTVYFGKYKLSYAEIYQSGTLIRNLIPCKRNSDNVLGMYDTVTGTFFTNQGTGDFIAGPVVVPSPDTPIDIVCNNGVLKYGVIGKNLFDSATKTVGVILNDIGTESGSPNGSVSDYIKVKPNTTYTLSFIRTTTSIYGIVCTYSANKIFINLKIKDENTDAGNRTYTFTTDSNAEYIRFCFKTDSKNIQLEQGSTATSYEPYQAGIYTDGTQEVVTDNLGHTATAEMLLAVGDYKDSQEVIGGVVKRKVGIKVLDGSEDWVLSTAVGTSSLFYCTQTNMDYTSTSAAICTHYTGELPSVAGSNQRDKSIKASYDNSEITHIRLYLRDTSFATLSDLTTFLANQYNAGTPVIIIYPLETATTETVTAQPLVGNTVIVTAGSIDNLPIVTDNITKLKSRFITDANGLIQEVKRVYIGDNLVYSAEIEEQS